MRKTVFITSPELWQRGHGPDHPLRPMRLKRTVELLEEFKAFEAPNVQVITPRLSTEDELALFHNHEYITAVRLLSKGDTHFPAYRYGFGPGDNPVFSDMFDIEALRIPLIRDHGVHLSAPRAINDKP